MNEYNLAILNLLFLMGKFLLYAKLFVIIYYVNIIKAHVMTRVPEIKTKR